MPLAIRGGCADSPAVLLTLRAHAVVPDLELSTANLDFGTVANAHCKVGGSLLDGIGWGYKPASASPRTNCAGHRVAGVS